MISHTFQQISYQVWVSNFKWSSKTKENPMGS